MQFKNISQPFNHSKIVGFVQSVIQQTMPFFFCIWRRSGRPGARLALGEGVLWLFRELQKPILTPEVVAEVFAPELRPELHDKVLHFLKRNKIFLYSFLVGR